MLSSLELIFESWTVWCIYLWFNILVIWKKWIYLEFCTLLGSSISFMVTYVSFRGFVVIFIMRNILSIFDILVVNKLNKRVWILLTDVGCCCLNQPASHDFLGTTWLLHSGLLTGKPRVISLLISPICAIACPIWQLSVRRMVFSVSNDLNQYNDVSASE